MTDTGWHKGKPVIWYGRQSAGAQFHWYCQVCKAMGVHDRLSFAWTEGEQHRKVRHPHD